MIKIKGLIGIIKNLIVGIIAVCIIGVPFWMLLVNSFKPGREAIYINMKLPQQWNIIKNYTTVIVKGRMAAGFINTLVVSLISVTVIILIASSASWIFARIQNRIIQFLYYISISGVLIHPAMITTIRVMRSLKIYGGLSGLILFYSGVWVSFAIFLITGFIKSIPISLEESATIDGCSPYSVFFYIVFPLLKPVIASAAIIILLLCWNDFLYPLYLIRSSKSYTLMLNLFSVVSSYQYQVKWELMFAYIIVVSLPLIIIYFLLQKRIISGITLGAVKQ